ncbi:hypothetical protein C8F04DRAFT_1177875 [Mycena alexandri]|uniref:Uncharacterized protein n=1 Tax=Mycena alexandri TaxID=1745969 RepID=A0AAD6T688_9AGAR|nr:hypothetical protein C8F04DRAFT_1177875 [Mycena alexandri]
MLVLVAVAAAALLVAALIDHLFYAPPLSPLQWCEYHGATCGLRALYLFTPPSLKQINNLHPLARIAALAGFPSIFAREGPGFLYVLGLVDDWILGDWHAHRIGDKEFLAHFRFKIGVAVDVPRRQRGYRKCDVLQSHFWLWSFRVRNRMVAGHGGFLKVYERVRVALTLLGEREERTRGSDRINYGTQQLEQSVHRVSDIHEDGRAVKTDAGGYG